MTQIELDDVLKWHKRYLTGHPNGVKARLADVDLRDADLRGAYLQEADLCMADLRGANLMGARLDSANLERTDVITFSLGNHFGFAHFGAQYRDGSYVRIDCIDGCIESVMDCHIEAGRRAGYSNVDIMLYGDMLKLLKNYQRRLEHEESI